MYKITLKEIKNGFLIENIQKKQLPLFLEFFENPNIRIQFNVGLMEKEIVIMNNILKSSTSTTLEIDFGTYYAENEKLNFQIELMLLIENINNNLFPEGKNQEREQQQMGRLGPISSQTIIEDSKDSIVDKFQKLARQKSIDNLKISNLKESISQMMDHEVDEDINNILKSCEELETFQEELRIGDEVIINPRNFIATIDSVITSSDGLKYGITLKNGVKLRNPWPKEELLLKKFDNTMFLVFLGKVQNIIKNLIMWSKPYKETSRIQKENEKLLKENAKYIKEINELEKKTEDLGIKVKTKEAKIEKLENEIKEIKIDLGEKLERFKYDSIILPLYQTNSVFLVRAVLHHSLFFISNSKEKEILNNEIDNLNVLFSKINLSYAEFDSIFSDSQIQDLLRKAIQIIKSNNRILPKLKMISFNDNKGSSGYYDLSYFIKV